MDHYSTPVTIYLIDMHASIHIPSPRHNMRVKTEERINKIIYCTTQKLLPIYRHSRTCSSRQIQIPTSPSTFLH